MLAATTCQPRGATAEGGWLDPAHPVEKGVANKAAACKDPEKRYMQL